MTIDVGIVKMVPITKVNMSDRARQVMGDLEGLETDMKESGLIQPLAMQELSDGTYRLLAGGRRFTVLLKNMTPEIPARIYQRELSDLELKMIEKSENFHRKDMEYYEMDKLTLEIHKMQQEIHGVKERGPTEGWAAGDTAEMLNYKSPATVTTAIKRAEAREAFPTLFENCKTASDASKVMKKIDETLTRQIIAKKLEQELPKNSSLQLANNFIIKSVFQGIKDVPDRTIHLVEIDPPYAIDLNKVKKSEGESQYVKANYNEIDTSIYIEGSDDPEHPWKGLRTLLKECYRTMVEHSWLICWFAPEPWFEPIYQTILDAGFKSTRMTGIWPKGSGQSLNPSVRLANSYEQFFYAWKGSPALNKPGSTNEFRYPPVSPQKKVHPTERPIELMEDLYETFVFPGSRIMIPFLGSGVGLLAAMNKGYHAFGYELSKGYKDSFLVRLNEIQQII